MKKPRITEKSSIIGKVLYIRRASEAEREDAGVIIKKNADGQMDLTNDEIVVASQENSILGFAVLRKGAGIKSGCVGLFETRGHRGIGKQLLSYLIERRTEEAVCN